MVNNWVGRHRPRWAGGKKEATRASVKKMFFNNFKKWILSCETGGLYQDFIRGVSIVRVFLTMAPEQVFMELERIRLQHRLVPITKKLSNAYRRLGEQGIFYLSVDSVESSAVLAGEAIDRICQQIEVILKDQEQVLNKIEQGIDITMSEERGEILGAKRPGEEGEREVIEGFKNAE
ncbi:MAG: hypothetical protein HY201_02105 [Nitrospirae bacterium]|nr:hypothetical protein [Candidatus Troglogloeales bacterium]MBI3598237.1 hypothetical protein [Candidatus Troglogloeales bacterium]